MGQTNRQMISTQTLNVLIISTIISTSTTHNEPKTGTYDIISMNELLHCDEIFDCILFNPYQVRNYGIGF